MLGQSIVAAALFTIGAVMGQSQNFSIDATKVTDGTKATWCSGQQNTCITLCSQNPKANECTPSTLTFNCLCQNNSAPGLGFYLQTLPTFICNEAYKQCNDANVGNAAGQSNCTNSIQKKCGTIDPNKATIPDPSATTGAPSPSGATNGPSSTSTSKAAAPTNVQHYGNGAAAVAVGLFAYLL